VCSNLLTKWLAFLMCIQLRLACVLQTAVTTGAIGQWISAFAISVSCCYYKKAIRVPLMLNSVYRWLYFHVLTSRSCLRPFPDKFHVPWGCVRQTPTSPQGHPWHSPSPREAHATAQRERHIAPLLSLIETALFFCVLCYFWNRCLSLFPLTLAYKNLNWQIRSEKTWI
jgi:hypothetical protein